MHMADALVSTAVSGTMYAASAAAAAYSLKKIKEEQDFKKIPVMGVMGAFIFATQMLNFTIPGTGSSGHLCGGVLASALLGPYAGFLTMVGVLLLQCLLFADGGILALGANCWNMAFYGCFIGALLIWRPIMRNGLSKKKIIFASVFGCVVTLEMGAFSVVLETTASQVSQLPFGVFSAVMLPIHLAIGFVEGLITSAVLVFISEARPEMLWGVGTAASGGKLSVKKTLAVILIVAVVFIFGISRFASSNPDGLEWSIQNLTGSTELETEGDSAHENAQAIQDSTAIFPDYEFSGFRNSDGSDLTSVAAAVLVVAAAAGISYAVRKNHTRNK